MRRLEQQRFKEEAFNASGLNLHTHVERRARSLVLFVHGLNGRGYRTWGQWPRLAFDEERSDRPGLDVALYDYASMLRAALSRGADLDFRANQLAAHLSKLAESYSEIYVVAHSLGGLLAEAALEQFLSRRALNDPETSAVTPIAALILLASPRAGSGAALRLLGGVIREFGWLNRHSARQKRADTFFASHVEGKAVASSGPRRFLLPRFAALASADRVVDSFSATFGVDENQRLHLTGSHTSLVKPTTDKDPQHQWLLEVVRQVGDLRTQWRREQEQRHRVTARFLKPKSVTTIVTKLLSDHARVSWETAYNQARIDASTEHFNVSDYRSFPDGTPVDLLITVHDATSVLQESKSCRSIVESAYSFHEASWQSSVGICPVGLNFREAEREVVEWVPSPPHRAFYIEGAHDVDGFREMVTEWIEAVVQRHTQTNSSIQDASRNLSSELYSYDDTERLGYL